MSKLVNYIKKRIKGNKRQFMSSKNFYPPVFFWVFIGYLAMMVFLGFPFIISTLFGLSYWVSFVLSIVLVIVTDEFVEQMFNVLYRILDIEKK